MESGWTSQTVDIFRTVFGRRGGHTRAIILLLMTIMLLFVATDGQ